MDNSGLNTTGGSQPQTQNPQRNVGGGVQQPQNSNLQPTPGQTGVSQQSLPSVNTLTVMVPTSGNNTTSIQPLPASQSITSWPWAIGALIIAVVVVAIARYRPRPVLNQPLPDEEPEEVIEPQMIEAPKPSSSPKPKKRKNTKKRRKSRK